jgi:glycosyltransferase involved in cell wall biosynthesis
MSLISVIIPARNGANYLKEAVESVKKQDMDTEIIVVDDGSTDDTANLARDLGVNCLSIPPSGPSTARNAGLREANGEYIMFLDHDDLLNDNALAAMLDEFKLDNEIQIVSAKLRDFISPELDEKSAKALAPRIKPYGGLLTGAFLFRKSALEKIGGFDENMRDGGECVDFLLKIESVGGKTKKLDMVSAMRRLHNTNTGRSKQKQEFEGFANALRRKLIR